MKKALSRIIALILVTLFLLSSVSALAAGYTLIVQKSMPLYSDSRMTNRIGTVPKWMIAVVSATSGTGSAKAVAKVNVNGKTGYARLYDMAGDLSVFGNLPIINQKVRTARACRAYVYPSKKSKSVTLKRGRKLIALVANGGWVLCSDASTGYLCYIQKKNLA